MLSIVLPVIGLLEDRIYRKSRERYLETKAAAERQKLVLSTGARPLPRGEGTVAAAAMTRDADAIDWYGLYG
jgi:hypothetical protein